MRAGFLNGSGVGTVNPLQADSTTKLRFSPGNAAEKHRSVKRRQNTADAAEA